MADKRMTSWKVIPLLLVCVGVSLFHPQSISAQMCPANFNDSISPTDDLPVSTKLYNERGVWTDVLPIEYQDTINGPLSGGTIRWGIEARVWAQMFTRMYTNYSNVIYPFIKVNMQDGREILAQNIVSNTNATVDNWNRFYCIQGIDDIKAANVTINFTGDYYDSDEVTKYRDCLPLEPDPDLDGQCPYEDLEEERWSENSSNTSDISSPYYALLRETAVKTAYLLGKPQYCNLDTDCINGNYFCDITKPPLSVDAAGFGKAGSCTLTPEGSGKLETGLAFLDEKRKSVDILCTDLVTPMQSIATKKLGAGMCIYNGDYGYESSNDGARPKLTEGTVGSGDVTMQFPFDVDLFADNGERLNEDCKNGGRNCMIDGYYRRGLMNTVSSLTYDDIKRLNDIPAKLTAGIEGKGSIRSLGNGGLYNYAFVDKLGSFDFWGEEARRVNPNLELSGYASVTDGPIEAYIRMHNNQNGVLFINEEPVGIRDMKNAAGVPFTPNRSQTRPVVSKQIKGSGYAVMTYIGQTPFISYSPRGGSPDNLAELPNNVSLSTAYYSLAMNSEGDVAVFGLDSGMETRYYGIYNGRERKFSGYQNFPIGYIKNMQVSIDSEDNLHTIGYGGEGSSVLIYGKFSFKGGILSPISSLVSIPFPGRFGEYRSIPFTIQTDKNGNAHIAANVAKEGDTGWIEGSIYYTKVSRDGAVGPLELAVDVEADYRSGYFFCGAEANGGNCYTQYTFSDRSSSIAVDIDDQTGIERVYIAYLNHQINTPEGETRIAANQAAYAKKDPSTGAWVQNLKLSDRMHENYGKITNINMDRYGNVVFTVQDDGSKYYSEAKYFDGAGMKKCLLSGENSLFNQGRFFNETIKCAYSREEVQYVAPPRSTAEGVRLLPMIDGYRLPSMMATTPR